jgi:GNAT superfamily N-acetyltransferase
MMTLMMITAEVELRICTADDASAVSLVLKEAFAEYESLYTKKGYEATAAARSAIVARMQQGPLWGAIYDKHVVGTASVVQKGADLYVRGMAVIPAVRGLGVGRLLLKQIEAFANEYHYERLFLSTTPFLIRAIRLYAGFGFCVIPDGPHDLFGTPLLTMEKALRPRSTLLAR